MKINRYIKTSISIIFMISVCLTGCRPGYQYNGDIDLTKHEWLKDKKIFLDPGHGGLGKTDVFRTGPDGIIEEEPNLKVALILKEMLKGAGARIFTSREKDVNIPLAERVKMVEKAGPDLLVSLHHNGTARRVDDVNYPSVLIWGCKDVSRTGYAFAELLLEEFNRLMDAKGTIISDFAIYTETGTMILRDTTYICPGVIGEPGFFTSEGHAKSLGDAQYLQAEAEAYFTAISRFFERGVPRAEAYISTPLDGSTYLSNLIKIKNPLIALKLESGIENIGIDERSIQATLDWVPVTCRALSPGLYSVQYGKKLYPGGHSLRFSFCNRRGQPSMIYRTGFTVNIEKGDYDRLVAEGTKKVKNRWTAREGLQMLLPALSMGPTDPGADNILWNIACGFDILGDRPNANYFFAKLYHFYPESKYNKNLNNKIGGYRYPVEYLGKWIDLKYDPAVLECNK